MTPFTDLQNFVVKHTDAKYFDSDKALYKRCFPESKIIPELDRAPEFAKKSLDERMITEILGHPDMCIDTVWEKRGFALLEGKLVPLEELKQTGLTEAKIKELVSEATVLIESIAGSSNMEGVKCIEAEITEKIEPLLIEVKDPILSNVKDMVEAQNRVFKAIEREAFLNRCRRNLQKIDLNTVKYNVLKAFIFDLNLNDKCKDHKAATYLEILEAEKAELNAGEATRATIETTGMEEPAKDIAEQQTGENEASVVSKKKEDHNENTPE